MAVRIFVEKENELLSTHTKNHPRLLSSSSITDTSLLQTPQSGKMLTTTPHLQQSARKALRDVNCSLRAGSKTGNSQKKKPDKVHKKKNSTSNFKSTDKPSILEPPKTEDYPEIETFIPYDPFDFEDFNVPEEHRLDHICLAGLPLLCLEKEETLLKKVLNKIPSPLEWPSLAKESNLMDFDMNADILANLDEVELPMMEDDF